MLCTAWHYLAHRTAGTDRTTRTDRTGWAYRICRINRRYGSSGKYWIDRKSGAARRTGTVRTCRSTGTSIVSGFRLANWVNLYVCRVD